MIKIIKKVDKEEFKDFLYHINLDDDNLYKEANNSQLGIFQMTGNTASNLIKRVKPKSFTELNIINAAARPGTINFIEDYIKNEDGQHKKYPEQIHSLIEDSRGVIFFQEQIMSIFNKVGGFSLEETNYTRSLMKKLGKKEKKQEDIVSWNNSIKRFGESASKVGLKEEEVIKIADDLLGLAEYSFNKSHSAAYTYIAIQTLYLSYYFKPYFYSAILSSKSDTDLLEYIAEIQSQDIKIIPPDINTSKDHFYPLNDKTIQYGLVDIKFVGDNPYNKILTNRPYKSLYDFITKTRGREISSRVIEALISTGCFDWYDKNRKKLLIIATEFWENKKAIKIEEKLQAIWDSIEAKYNTLTITDFTNDEMVEIEKKFFGFRLFTPMFSPELVKIFYSMYSSDLIYISINEVEESKKVPICVDDIRKLTDKNKNEMAFVSITDLHGNNVSIPIFASYWKYLGNEIEKGKTYFFNLYRDYKDAIMFGKSGKITEEIIIRRMIKKIETAM